MTDRSPALAALHRAPQVGTVLYYLPGDVVPECSASRSNDEWWVLLVCGCAPSCSARKGHNSKHTYVRSSTSKARNLLFRLLFELFEPRRLLHNCGERSLRSPLICGGQPLDAARKRKAPRPSDEEKAVGYSYPFSLSSFLPFPWKIVSTVAFGTAVRKPNF